MRIKKKQPIKPKSGLEAAVMQKMQLAGIPVRTEADEEETKFPDSFVADNRSLFDSTAYDEYSEASDMMVSGLKGLKVQSPNRSFVDSPRLERFMSSGSQKELLLNKQTSQIDKNVVLLDEDAGNADLIL